jgi:hypothetical protein
MSSLFSLLSEKATRGDFWVLLLMLTWLLCLIVLAMCAFTDKFTCDSEIVNIFAGVLKILIGATTIDLGINVLWKKSK